MNGSIKLALTGVSAALFLSACGGTAATPTSESRSASIKRGAVASTVNATGSIQANDEVKLGFSATGTIAAVNAKVGETVKKGAVLAALDTAETEISLAKAKLDVKNAEAALIIANANFSRTVDGPRAPDVAAAQAALGAAQAALDRAKVGPKPVDSAGAAARMRNAEAALKRAQSAYDAAYQFDPATITASPAALDLERATNDLAAAKAELDKTQQPVEPTDIRAAQQRVLEARANVDKVKLTARPYDIERAEAERAQAQLQIEQARLSLQMIERKLAQSQVIAPFDGVVSSVDMKAGEAVAATSLLTLVDVSQLITDINVDEVDVAKVTVGQDVLVKLDSLPGSEIAGKVTRIAPVSKIVNGVVTYAVRVAMTPGESALRPGMTANTRIVLERRENVMITPNWSLRRDAASGKAFLTLKAASAEAQPTEVEVTLGLADDANTEVLSGVNENQEIVEPVLSAAP
jgi:HlyD family secretion protein